MSGRDQCERGFGATHHTLPLSVEVHTPVAAHRADEVALVHTLPDRREAPVRERAIVVDLGEVATGRGAVARTDLVASRESADRGWRNVAGAARLLRARPR